MSVNTKINELLQCSAQKDQFAFKCLYEETSARLFSQVLHLVRRRSLAEEVLQEAYLKIWKRADSYDSTKGSVIGWMSVIARNTALDALRSLNSRPEEVEAGYECMNFAVTDFNEKPDKRTEFEIQVRRLIGRLKKLRPEQIQCLLFSYYYGYSHQELSELLGTPLGTIKGWLRRGSQLLTPG